MLHYTISDVPLHSYITICNITPGACNIELFLTYRRIHYTEFTRGVAYGYTLINYTRCCYVCVILESLHILIMNQ